MNKKLEDENKELKTKIDNLNKTMFEAKKDKNIERQDFKCLPETQIEKTCFHKQESSSNHPEGPKSLKCSDYNPEMPECDQNGQSDHVEILDTSTSFEVSCLNYFPFNS